VAQLVRREAAADPARPATRRNSVRTAAAALAIAHQDGPAPLVEVVLG
jgi:hypothetical protein